THHHYQPNSKHQDTALHTLQHIQTTSQNKKKKKNKTQNKTKKNKPFQTQNADNNPKPQTRNQETQARYE
ncbi:hypothetical protein Q6298_28905, partial [Klebsiella pneumoniae]|uniref:hypothetical protein n=1 Tax=Klebsiella pneumoniae TaxID=573 RepID=UPI00272F5951